MKETGLGVGDSSALVVQKLGQPDQRTEREDALYLGYGPKILVFRGDRLAGELTTSEPKP